MNIIVADNDNMFISDLESRLFIDEIDGVSVQFADSIGDAQAKARRTGADRVVIAGSLLDGTSRNDFNVPVMSYARNRTEEQKSEGKGVPCYGIISNTSDLIRAIENNTARPAPVGNRGGRELSGGSFEGFDESFMTGARNRSEGYSQGYDRQDGYYQGSGDGYREEPYGAYGGYGNGYRQEEARRDPYDRGYPDRGNREPDAYGGRGGQPEAGRQTGDSMRRRMEEKKRLDEERRRAEERGAAGNEYRTAVERDMGNVKDPAKLITVYSAKGGVGKTTISCELASFLALSAHGRGRLKVCLADFNIDFGDVLNTLALDPKRLCMTHWAADIREQLMGLPGKHPEGYSQREIESIRYTEKEMESYLQQVPDSGLYVLVAPITNEDSMDMSEDGDEVKVMLNNLVNNGGFDYVICDTGNNTRNSSFIPLEMSDQILMVITQSVNTANCNSSFISTAHAVGFDTSRIKIVINKARSGKSVGVLTDELVEAMIDPQTGKPFECVAVIKDNNDVRLAENYGKPLVYKPDHEFTKGIGEIAKAVNSETFVLEEPEKKKKKRFGRKRNKE